MEFLDPKNQKAHLIRLTIGYILVAIALLLTTIILLYHAYGFGLRDGKVIQNGLVFVSTRPDPASIYVNGQKRDETTNTRLLLPAGQYNFRLEREGYRQWKRAVTVEGGSVGRFDYPFLFPSKLETSTTKRYDIRPALATQSPDRRWLLSQNNTSFNTFELLDLNDQKKAPQNLVLPESLFGLTNGTHSWELVEWANDNRHVLLRHLTGQDGGKAWEYILVDRESPEESRNLTDSLGVNPVKMELRDKKYDKYLLLDTTQTLLTATLGEPTPQPFINGVLAFKSHGDDVVLYATTAGAQPGKTAVKLQEGDRTYTIRQVAVGDTYLLDLARYDGAWYVVAGAPSENRTYVYKNPAGALRSKPKSPLVPVQVLKVAATNYTSFSDNARFIMAQSGSNFAVYDAETDKGYAYALDMPLDAPQQHATWMDGHRMMFVSGGKVVVFDFDAANKEVLNAADAAYEPIFDRDFRYLYTITNQNNQPALTNTALRTVQDL